MIPSNSGYIYRTVSELAPSRQRMALIGRMLIFIRFKGANLGELMSLFRPGSKTP